MKSQFRFLSQNIGCPSYKPFRKIGKLTFIKLWRCARRRAQVLSDILWDHRPFSSSSRLPHSARHIYGSDPYSSASTSVLRVGPDSGLSSSKYFGSAYKRFCTGRVCQELLLNQWSWLNFQEKMINCELFSYFFFDTPPILRSCAYLDSLGKLDFRAQIGFHEQILGSGQVRASKWGRFTTLIHDTSAHCLLFVSVQVVSSSSSYDNCLKRDAFLGSVIARFARSESGCVWSENWRNEFRPHGTQPIRRVSRFFVVHARLIL